MSELLEKILDKKNMNEAYRKVCANKGAGGADGMELEEISPTRLSRAKSQNSTKKEGVPKVIKPSPLLPDSNVRQLTEIWETLISVFKLAIPNKEVYSDALLLAKASHSVFILLS